MWLDENIYILDTKWGGYREAIASYVVRSNDEYALIDTGYGATTNEIIKQLDQLGVGESQLKYIILTHTHLDHMGGAGLLLDKYSEAKVVTTEAGILNLIRPLRMYYGARMVFGEDFNIDFGKVKDVPKESMYIVEDGDELKLGDLTLRIVETPGHTRDHISIYIPENKTLITGDAVCNKYPGFDVLIPPASPPLYPVSVVTESINKIRRLKLDRLLIPHFGEVNQPEEFLEENIRVVGEWKEYIIDNLMKGHDYHQLVDMIKDKLIKEAKSTPDTMPKYVKEVVLPTLIRISVLGYMATYINRFPPET